MTTEQSISFMELSQEIAAINKKILDAARQLEDDDRADEVLQASTKLIQAQNNLLKAASK